MTSNLLFLWSSTPLILSLVHDGNELEPLGDQQVVTNSWFSTLWFIYKPESSGCRCKTASLDQCSSHFYFRVTAVSAQHRESDASTKHTSKLSNATFSVPPKGIRPWIWRPHTTSQRCLPESSDSQTHSLNQTQTAHVYNYSAISVEAYKFP